jgi:hypothetical protein
MAIPLEVAYTLCEAVQPNLKNKYKEHHISNVLLPMQSSCHKQIRAKRFFIKFPYTTRTYVLKHNLKLN